MPTVRQPSFQTPGHHPSALSPSFTRFVATHGGSDSLRAAERPSQMMNPNDEPQPAHVHTATVASKPRAQPSPSQW
jgi:hypothetical protein